MKRFLLVALLVLASCATAQAQAAPLVGTTLRTTSTAAGSVKVGCTQTGPCTGGVTAGPVDVASVTSAGFIEIASNVPVSQTNRLVNNAGTLSFNGVVLATGSSLSGTTNTIPLFTASNAVGNSIMTQSGTTITVANTLTATTLGGTLSTVSQPNVTTMAGLVSVGTITTGVWSATPITLAGGGTGANLSGTGGTSQFLRQNTLGGAVTVVRPATTDLSDGTNVALLNATNVFTATQTIGAGGTGSTQALMNMNGGSASSGGAGILFRRNSVTQSAIGTESTILSNTSNDLVLYAALSVGIKMYTGTLQRWGINVAGDLVFGPSSHIADSNGTPTIASGFSSPTIAGTDYAMVIHTLGGGGATGAVNFGHTFSARPVCTGVADFSNVRIQVTSTTQMSILLDSTVVDQDVMILCRGY